jgi:ketosteroid isomerase-like protein
VSQENVEVVRTPLQLREGSRRTLEQHLGVRFPVLAAMSARLLARLPPGSLLRQAVVQRAARVGVDAWNRRDFDAFLVGYRADFEVHQPRELVEAGFADPCSRGAEGYRKAMSAWFEVWSADLRLEPVRVIDQGTRIVMLYDVPLRGRASGVPLTGELATVATLRDGLVVRDQLYLHHAEALEAVGLSE